MQPLELNRLIEKYYDGLTSLQEEKHLFEWLQTSPDGAAHPEVLAQLSLMQQMHVEPGPDMGFDQQIKTKLQKEVSTQKRWVQITYRVTGIAAAILVFLAVWIGSELVKPTHVYGTITDPKLAFNETSRLLEKVSDELNKGLRPAQQSAEKLVKGVEKVEKAVEKSNQLNEISKASQYLNSFTRVYVKLGHNKSTNN